jgi:hypothetical protein
MINMEGFKKYRHENNPKEKEFHDKFIEDHGRNEDMDLIVFGQSSQIFKPNDYLTDKEKRIVIKKQKLRIKALEKQLSLNGVVGQSEQLACDCDRQPLRYNELGTCKYCDKKRNK